MRAVRRFGVAVGLGVLTVATAVGAGVVVHPDALIIDLEKTPAPLGTREPVRLQVSIRNRTAALVPVRGFGRSPAWSLQRQGDDGTWERWTGETPAQIAWLEPYHRERHELPVEAPGRVRAVLYSGLHGELEHASTEVRIEPDDFDHLPLAHY